MSDALAGERFISLHSQQRRGEMVGRSFYEAGRLLIGREHCLDLAAQGVVIATSFADERSALFGRAFERRLEQLIYLSPSLRLHHFSHPSTSGVATLWPRATRAARSA